MVHWIQSQSKTVNRWEKLLRKEHCSTKFSLLEKLIELSILNTSFYQYIKGKEFSFSEVEAHLNIFVRYSFRADQCFNKINVLNLILLGLSTPK